MEACPRCNTPWNEQGYCPNDGTLRQSGVTIGDRYELEQVIGSGGMGIVYAGRHKLLGKGVAIKVLRSDLTSDATQVARFLREAQLCSQMQHDNIVDITDFGRDTSGSLYIAMELLTGTSLAAVLEQEGPMSVERAIPILRQVCRALDCAHRAGVVHRDLTPRNVFLTQQSGRSDVVKLLDFGISRMVQSEDRITSTGIPLGTTAYMPPEQLRGESTQNHRVDIYALGVMAFQMLTGTLPFEQKTPALLITEKLSTDAKGRITTQLGQRYPGLAQLISECVSRDADQRPSSAVEVEQRLLSSPGAEVSQNENLSGLRAGSYRLVRLLGSGGLGSVWLGEHPVIGSKVAIKVLHPQICESMDAVRRFVVEAQTVNRIESPNIVRIFDFGKLPDGRDYAVMELLEGETLAARMARQGRFSLAEAMPLVFQIGQVLLAAHQAGVAHRDLKPDNVFLCGRPESPTVKILDFGIAKLLGDQGGGLHQTKLGLCMGTPIYAAPEQLAGQPMDSTVDIYALGVVLYELLTGRPPFVGGLQEMVSAKLTGSRPSLATELPELDPELTSLIERMLSVAPASRPKSMEEVLAVLARLPAAQVATPSRPATMMWDGPSVTRGVSLGPAASSPSPAPLPPAPALSASPAPSAAVASPLPAPLPPAPSAAVATEEVGPRRTGLPRGVWLVGLVVLLLGVAAALAFLLMRGSKPVETAVRAPAPTTKAFEATKAPEATRAPEAAKAPDATSAPEGTRRILVESTPSGAQVFLQGKAVGRTPVRLAIDPRLPSVSVVLQKKGYQRATTSLTPQSPEVVRLTLAAAASNRIDPVEPATAKRAKAPRPKAGAVPRAAKKALVNPFEDE